MHPRDPGDDTAAGLAFLLGHGLVGGPTPDPRLYSDDPDEAYAWADAAGELEHQQWPEDEGVDDE